MDGLRELYSENASAFWLIAGWAVLLAAIVGVNLALRKKYPGQSRVFGFISAAVMLVYALFILIILPTKKEKYEPLDIYGMYIFSLILIGALCVFAFTDKTDGNRSGTKAVAYAGISVAVSFGLSYVKLFSLPQGGSVTLASMLPLIIYSYAFGVKRGVTAGLVYGMLQLIQSPQVYQPMQVLLDYPIAFGGMGLAGIMKGKIKGNVLAEFTLAAVTVCLFRYAAHFLSGYYVFSSWAQEGYTALSWSLVYNLYIIAELAINVAAGCALLASKDVRAEIKKMGG